jgi:high-affinity iron transporter
LGAFVITLREGFEAALIVGLILAYLAKTDNLERHGRAVWTGAAAAVGASLLAGAILFASVGELEGTAEALYEGCAMLLAAAVVTWMVFWMRRQAATIGHDLRAQVGDSLAAGGSVALGAISFVAVGREGLETALFLFASSQDSGAVVAITAAVLGLLVAVALGVLVYKGALRLDLRRFFTITGLLVIGVAAWLIYGGLHELGEAASSELLEAAGPVLALAYAVGFGVLYLRGTRAPAAEHAAPAAVTVSQG